MYAVYVLEDEWCLLDTFSTRKAAEIFVGYLASRGLRAKVLRTADRLGMAA